MSHRNLLLNRIAALLILTGSVAAAAIPVVTDTKASPRERYGAEQLTEALTAANPTVPSDARILAATRSSTLFASFPDLPTFPAGQEEAFRLRRSGDTWLVVGSDASGVLYGCLELAARVRKDHQLPASIDFTDKPAFVLRGPNIGMQKTTVTYDGAIYDYRYTPEDFPFFYDKAEWTHFLDMLASNRMNTLYLWNGHPFTSLLKLPKYPEAQELTDEQLNRNIEMFRWLTTEADRRGIWVIQLFYNIHISHALAKAKGIPFHYSTPNQFVSDYTRYCVSEFIRTYPNVGLMMTLGEALRPEYGADWLSKTIIPGVKDGMKALGTTREPPIIVRAHATRIDDVIHAALPLYKNIYTMHKWNGESLTWTDVRGEQADVHKRLVALGSIHIVNVHLLANLEPFRWGAPSFIQKVMLSSQRIGIRGLHLYPLRYWDWPQTADNTKPPLLQTDRDWIWFEAWARYSWNPNRDVATEREYWIGRIATKYGTREAAAKILDAYEASGVCAPRMLPRVGITEGNRQAFSLGMLMTQLIDDKRYSSFAWLWTGDAPPGERLDEWVKKEWEHQPHSGETPIGVARESVASAEKAVASAEAARPYVTRNQAEFERFANDMHCIATLMRYYEQRVEAAQLVMHYGYSHDVQDLVKARQPLEQSLAEYRKLVALTDKTYREACSIHSASRRIPFWGAPGRYTHWRDCLPEYEKETANFSRNLKLVVDSNGTATGQSARTALTGLPVKLEGSVGELFPVGVGQKLYTDHPEWKIEALAPELEGLTGIRIPYNEATERPVRVAFELAEPAQMLVGFFSSKPGRAAQPPADEWAPLYMNAVDAGSHPSFSVWAHAVPAGRNEVNLGRGAYVILGFVKQSSSLQPRMVFFDNARTQNQPYLDWLFE